MQHKVKYLFITIFILIGLVFLVPDRAMAAYGPDCEACDYCCDWDTGECGIVPDCPCGPGYYRAPNGECYPVGPCVPTECDAECGGGTDNCGDPCNEDPCCTKVPPSAPTKIFPSNAQSFTYNPAVAFQWSAPSSWGEGCGNALSFRLCVNDSTADSCNRYDKPGIPSTTTTDATFVPAFNGTHYWRVGAVNNGQTTWSTWWSFSVQVSPNCSNLNGPLEPRVGVSNSYTADFYSPQNELAGHIFRTDLTSGNIIINSDIPGSTGSLTGFWTPSLSEAGNRTVYCRAWNDARSECRPPAFPTSPWPLSQCAGPTTSLDVCVEGFDITNPSYVSNWTAWSACGNSGPLEHKRTRTRTCAENCLGVTNDCNTYFSDPGSCPVAGECTFVGNTQTQTQDCRATFTGRLFDASDCPPGICSCDLSTPLGTGSAVIVTPYYSWGITSTPPITVNSSGTFTFNAFLGSTNNDFPLDFTNLLNANQIGDSTPKAYCPYQTPSYLGCDPSKMDQPCRPQIVPPDASADTQYFDFGFYRKYGGWWQVEGGKVHANQDISSSIPASVDPLPWVPATSNQKLILDDANGRNGLVTYGNSLSTGSNPNALVSNGNTRFNQTYHGQRYDYEYFSTKLNLNTYEEWENGSTPPSYQETGDGFMLLRYTGSLPLAIDTFNVSSGEKYIVLVPGQANVTGNITVDNGGHFTLIASGDIHFTSSSEIAEGWFVSNGMIYVDSTGDELTDQQFQGNGSFVAWGGFSLNRNRGITNNKFPSELFTFRNDLLNNSPEILGTPYRIYSPYNP